MSRVTRSQTKTQSSRSIFHFALAQRTQSRYFIKRIESMLSLVSFDSAMDDIYSSNMQAATIAMVGYESLSQVNRFSVFEINTATTIRITPLFISNLDQELELFVFPSNSFREQSNVAMCFSLEMSRLTAKL